MTAPKIHVGAEASAIVHAFEVAVEAYAAAETRRFDALTGNTVSRESYDLMRDRVSQLRNEVNAARIALLNLIHKNTEDAR